MGSNLPYAADAESPLRPAELQVLRAQYEKEGDYVGIQTKFNYAWGLIKSNARPEQQEGVRLLSEIFRAAPERRRECLYYLALGNYKLGNYGEARRYNDLLLEHEPANLQAGSLRSLIDDKVSKEGLVGIAIIGGLAVAAGVVGSLVFLSSRPKQEQQQQQQNRKMADTSEDRMFCHACNAVWLRNEHGLTCPQCGSEFTEIIEIPPEETHPDPSPINLTPPPRQERRQQTPINTLADHNPWADDHETDPYLSTGSRGSGFSRHTYRSPDGRFTFTSTTYNGGFPPGRGMMTGDPLMLPMVRSLDTIFHGLADTYHPEARSPLLSRGASPLQQERGRESSPQYAAAGGRLYPRDTEGPQPMGAALGTLNDVLDLFRQDFESNGTVRGGGVRVMTGPNPLAILSSLLNVQRHGDAVYSQEELDRVISQLIDQNVNGTAPPPAPETAIRSLPKKKIDEEMLGSEGKAECSICMDAVELGTEVTVLPCKHWFHEACIEMWLNQHNTCPHCRRGINENSEGSQRNPVVIPDSPEPPPRRRSSARPYDIYGRPGWPTDRDDRPAGWGDSNGQDGRRASRDGNGGGITGWMRSRFGGAS
ncbi:hypothetical protein ASPZODRAFT_15887 [Penicilliopsis zonata CBS 506.65]|uniref:Mitochondrial fission 1 protein n=1 Tax=Penicilliopsis zonata CBS 506.65 TaxID=1073090 RepID=A0A1L9SJ01_9EURO|nr:hypothetical protein ASPZODRAFT_15887 [Penicilliopsis zonata CBS 506.65]OJJ47210.1 hypothetical protein ASPZODRAFT_15887 [Penicilliopsis zonata CBS 506.65]